MDPTLLVFARDRGELLLTRPSHASGISGDRWCVPVADLDPGADPLARAREVLTTRFDLDPGEPIRSGGPVDLRLGGRTVQAFGALVDVDGRTSDVSNTAGPVAWAHPTELIERDVPGGLWRVYESIAPSVRSIGADTRHGSSYLSRRALEVMRDRAAVVSDTGDAGDELSALARDLRSVRPDMLAIKIRVARVMAEGAQPEKVSARAREALVEAATAADEAATTVADRLESAGTVCCFSRSGTVRRAVDRIDPDEVVVPVAAPGEEGIAFAENLVSDRSVTLAPDAAIGALLEGADGVLVGADGIGPSGTVLNKVGTRTVAGVACQVGVPVLVVSTTAKCGPIASLTEHVPATTIYEGDRPLSIHTERFDRTPGEWIDAYCTERGALTRDVAAQIARRHADLLADG